MKLKIRTWQRVRGRIDEAGQSHYDVFEMTAFKVEHLLDKDATVEEVWLLNGRCKALPKWAQRAEYALAQVKYSLMGMRGMKTETFLVKVVTMKAKPREVRACSSANRAG